MRAVETDKVKFMQMQQHFSLSKKIASFVNDMLFSFTTPTIKIEKRYIKKNLKTSDNEGQIKMLVVLILGLLVTVRSNLDQLTRLT